MTANKRNDECVFKRWIDKEQKKEKHETKKDKDKEINACLYIPTPQICFKLKEKKTKIEL
jgi:hypothetical protein